MIFAKTHCSMVMANSMAVQNAKYKFNQYCGEISGAFADLGTFLPLVLGLIALNQFSPQGIFLGFGIFFAIAYAMFYSGQWGGGDSKMLMGIGAALGLPVSLVFPYVEFHSLIIAFWFNLLLAGVVYAFGWTIYVAIKQRRKFGKELKIQLKQRKNSRCES